MRFGLCGNLAASKEDPAGIAIIEKLKHFGYDYVELPLSEIMDMDREEQNALRNRLEKAGIWSEVFNNFFPPSLKLTGPLADRNKIRQYYREAMQLAKSLGAETIVFGSPGAKSYPQGFSKAKAMEQLLNLTEEVNQEAERIGITIAIEPIRRPECNLINTFLEGVELAKRVNGGATKVLVDYYHMTWEQEPIEHLRQYGEWLTHVHFACPYLPGEGERNIPLDFSEWKYGEFVDTLHKIGYQGTVSIEAYSKNFDEHAEAAIKLMKTYF